MLIILPPTVDNSEQVIEGHTRPEHCTESTEATKLPVHVTVQTSSWVVSCGRGGGG